jgi:hydrogenase expression/formation protein HypC
MCLAIPAKITEVKEGNSATVDILGVTREIATDFTPGVEVGSYVLVHAGFAIETITEQDAQETLDLIKQFPELAGLDVDTPAADTEAAV